MDHDPNLNHGPSPYVVVLDCSETEFETGNYPILNVDASTDFDLAKAIHLFQDLKPRSLIQHSRYPMETRLVDYLYNFYRSTDPRDRSLVRHIARRITPMSIHELDNDLAGGLIVTLMLQKRAKAGRVVLLS